MNISNEYYEIWDVTLSEILETENAWVPMKMQQFPIEK